MYQPSLWNKSKEREHWFNENKNKRCISVSAQRLKEGGKTLPYMAQKWLRLSTQISSPCVKQAQGTSLIKQMQLWETGLNFVAKSIESRLKAANVWTHTWQHTFFTGGLGCYFNALKH